MRISLQRLRGLSVVEVCCTLAIVGILAALAIPTLSDLVDARRLEGAARQLAADIRFARSEAIARNQTLRLSIHDTPTGHCYVVHTSAPESCRCLDSGPARCDGSASIRTVHLPARGRISIGANTRSLSFDPLHGTVSPAATLRVVGARGHEIRQVVNILGRIRSCSPGAHVAGHAPC